MPESTIDTTSTLHFHRNFQTTDGQQGTITMGDNHMTVSQSSGRSDLRNLKTIRIPYDKGLWIPLLEAVSAAHDRGLFDTHETTTDSEEAGNA